MNAHSADRFVFEDRSHASWAGRIMRRIPVLAGEPIHVARRRQLRDRYGEVHGGSFLRERCILLNCSQMEFPRVFVHEVFHFVWVRFSNRKRWSYEDLMRAEWKSGARGELGWSAEWRKRDLLVSGAAPRKRLWREYCCESFCDTA